jgi:hypothetical protein
VGEGPGDDRALEMARAVGDVGPCVEGRVSWWSGAQDSCFRGPSIEGLGRWLDIWCRWGTGLELLRGCLCYRSVVDVLWGLVGALHLGGVFLGGGGGIHVEGRRDRVHVRP